MAIAELEPGTAASRVRRADHSATLPPVYDNDDDDEDDEDEDDDVMKTTNFIEPC